MPPEKEIVAQSFSWWDRTLLSFIAMFMVGTMARIFVSNEPFELRRFAGEMLLAALAAVMLYSFGLLQGLSTSQMMLLGSLGGLGGVRFVEHVIQLVKMLRQVS